MSLDGRVALVTGAAGRGLGRSIALTLAREGAAVVINYQTAVDAAQEIVAHITGAGGQALAVAGDVTDARACRDLVDASMAHFGRVDICLIGPGGGWHPEPLAAPAGQDTLSPEDALDDVRRETAPVMNLMAATLPGMYARGWGRIIGIASHPIKRSPAYAYNAAKAARLEALLLATDQAWEHGVTVNVIAPGPVSPLGDLAEAAAYAESACAESASAAQGEPWSGRTNVTPQDMAEGVAFLCSDAGRYVSGCVLPYLFR